MQYKVPQNVDVEDRVIAGLTLRQFMFILVAGGVALLEYYGFRGALQFLFLPMAIITMGIGAAFAFLKINDRPFETFILAAFKSFFQPRMRVWKKDVDVEIPPHTDTKHTRKDVAVRKKQNLDEMKSGLERLAAVVDSGGVIGSETNPDRPTNVISQTIAEPEHIHDVLAKTEEAAPAVDAIMAQAKDYVEKNKKEETVGSMAKVTTSKNDFEYEKIELADEKKLEDTLKKVHQKQEELEEKLESAKIEKFER